MTVAREEELEKTVARLREVIRDKETAIQSLSAENAVLSFKVRRLSEQLRPERCRPFRSEPDRQGVEL